MYMVELQPYIVVWQVEQTKPLLMPLLYREYIAR
jgi:hypothetical protein